MTDTVAYVARRGVIDGVELADPYVEVDGAGIIVRTASGDAPPVVVDLGPSLLLPGMVSAHSHAFQRTIRGRTQRRGATDPSSFWSWRQAMYQAAATLDADAFEAATFACYREMLRAGITWVGEFHYVHHQPGGAPYPDPNELSWRVVRAAERAGIRLTLLEVYYARGGPDRALEPAQRRFHDASVGAYLDRVEALRAAGVHVGLAPHSVRAVPAPDLAALAEHAARFNLPLHIHLSEQPAENEACQAEHGCSPAELLARVGALARPRGLTAVHAVHLTEHDRALLAEQIVCACPTTEADLGDGIVAASELAAAGTALCLGSDSNSIIDLIQEARLLEMHERLRTGRRLCLGGPERPPALAALDAATAHGALALGASHGGARLAVGEPFDACVIDLTHPTLADVAPEHALDAALLAGTAAAVRATFVGGSRVH